MIFFLLLGTPLAAESVLFRQMMPNPIFDVAAADDSSITAECAADYQKFTATLYDVPDVLREENFWAAKSKTNLYTCHDRSVH